MHSFDLLSYPLPCVQIKVPIIDTVTTVVANISFTLEAGYFIFYQNVYFEM